MNTGFGTATLKPRAPRDRGRRFDCGRYGKLSAKQIAQMTGMSREGVWQRVNAGFKGEDLCQPKHQSLRKAKETCKRPVVVVAVKLARAFPDRVPTLEEIRKVHAMGDRNAMRWRQALAETIGERA